MNKELLTIFQCKGRCIEKVKEEKLSWLCDGEEVQFLWCMISPSAIDDENVRQLLLQASHLGHHSRT